MLKKVFLPQCCVRAPPGILIGTSNSENTVFYIVAVVHFPVKPRNLNSYLTKHEKLRPDTKGNEHAALKPLGTWFPNNCDEKKDGDFRQMIPKLFGQTSWITLQANKNDSDDIEFISEEAELCITNDILASNSYKNISNDFLVVIYNQKEVWDGEFSDETVFKTGISPGLLEELFDVISTCKKGILSYKSGICTDDEISVTHCCVEREVSIVSYLLTIFITVILTFIYLLFNMMQMMFCKIYTPLSFMSKTIHKCVEVSTFLAHFKRRVSDLHRSLKQIFEEEPNTRAKEKRYDNNNLIASVFVDIIFGVVFLWSLYQCKLLPPAKTTQEVFLPYVEAIANQVEELIKWLMGIPAGLKLNHSLNQFLGHFFLYHVRLWLEYAKMMMDLFPHLITYCLMSSCFGFSFLLSIISDAISTLSFHVYCFYVYAGRLYGLQVAGLTSMWRLFRGKKWNPLRKRVDSLEESGQRADQLFAGTLLFTVLLFLLPTTVLYYGIFMLLRVAVLAIQVLLSGLTFLLTEFPWYSIVVRIFSPHKFIKSIQCSMLSRTFNLDAPNLANKHQDGQALVFLISVQPKSLGGIVSTELKRRKDNSSDGTGFRVFLGKIVFGELIRWT